MIHFQWNFFLTLSLVLFASTLEASNYCKVGRYFYNSTASICQNRDTNYCFSRRLGYVTCPPQLSNSQTRERRPGQATFCKRGDVFHNGNSSLCRNRSANHCYSRVRGYYKCTAPKSTQSSAEDSKASDVPLPPPNPHRNAEETSEPQQAKSQEAEPAQDTGAESAKANSSLPSTPPLPPRNPNRGSNAKEDQDKTSQTETASKTDAESDDESEDDSTPEGEYCKVGRYWHYADSPICRGRPIDQCLINGRYGDCEADSSTPSDVKTKGYQRIKCDSQQNPFQCMMCNCYHEARSQGPEERLAVNKVVMTRARMNSYPNSICKVVYQNSHRRYPQFSWTNGAARRNVMGRVGYQRCEKEVREALNFKGHSHSHYHRHDVYPKWRHSCRGRKRIGAHYFYSDCGRQRRANPGVDVSV